MRSISLRHCPPPEEQFRLLKFLLHKCFYLYIREAYEESEMSTQITIGRGQGITQAIVQQLNLNKEQSSKIDTDIWSQVLTEIKNDNNNKTKFKKADTQYNSDTKDFKGWNVRANEKISLDNTTLSNIKQLINNALNGTSNSTVGTTPITTSNPTVEAPEKTIQKEADSVEIRPLSPDATTVKAPEEQPLFATGKQLTRYVDGQKQTIEIGQNDNGQKTRYLVNKDGTRGEELVTMTTVGKNTYQTKSKFEADVKLVLGLGEKEEIPADLKPFYVEIGGEAQLMFKSPQGTLTPKQALALVKQNKSTTATQTPSPTQTPTSTSTPTTTIQESTADILNEEQANTVRNARGYSTTTAPTQPTPQTQPKAAPQTSEHTQNTVLNNAQDVEYSDLSSMGNGQNVTINGETYSARYGAHGLVFDGPDGTYNLEEMQQFFEE